MAKRATYLSRMSLGINRSGQTLVDIEPADTGDVLSVHGNQTHTGDFTNTGAISNTGALTNVGALVVDGASDLSGAVILGGIGTSFLALSSSTHDLAFGAIPDADSLSTPLTIAGALPGDIVMLSPDAAWSGNDLDVVLSGFVSALNTVQVVGSNVSTAATTPAAGALRVSLIRYSTFT